MKEWSRLKKTVVISAVAIFGLGGLGSLTDQKTSTISPPASPPAAEPITPPKVQGETTQPEAPAQAAPTAPPKSTPVTPPAQTPEPEPKPAVDNSCDPNYSGACVPIASDVDCGGGSGNGPAYLYGTATVVGSDIYGLDRDGDGLACE